MTFKPQYIVLHHSAETDEAGLDVDDFERWHLERGFRKIGYHAVVEQVEPGRYDAIVGRPWDEQGAHALGFNTCSLGVCVAGNFEIAPPPAAQVHVALQKVILPWARLFGIVPERIVPHRDIGRTPTLCPGKYFPVEDIRAAVSADFEKLGIMYRKPANRAESEV